MVTWGLIPLVIAMTVLTLISVRNLIGKAITVGSAAVLMLGFYVLEAKFWGVVLMGLGIGLFLFLPWLDRAPVKSIRYRGWMFKLALAIFVLSFLILGYLGTQPASGIKVVVAQVCTILYLLFFLLMPWYTTFDKTKPEPERVTMK